MRDDPVSFNYASRSNYLFNVLVKVKLRPRHATYTFPQGSSLYRGES